MIPGNKISDFKLKDREFQIPRRGLLRVKNFSVGTVRSNDADGDENVKKNNSFHNQNNNFARASRLFVHFFAVYEQLRRENA